jgi:cytochrome c-type biogenesis protein CcmH/NrfG
MPAESKSKILQRILIFIFGLAFVGSSGVFLIGMFTDNSSTRQAATPENAPASATQQLQAEAKGYETVLGREPNNPIALQGLAKTRLDLQDFQGAIAPLEKLTKLYPQQQELQALLTFVKQQATQAKSKEPQKPQNNSLEKPKK